MGRKKIPNTFNEDELEHSSFQHNKRQQFLLEQTELFQHFLQFRNKTEPVISEKKMIKTTSSDRRHHPNIDHKSSDITDEESEYSTESTLTHFQETPSYIKNGIMRDYQVQGLNWLISLYENGINGILADEMGLGKTLQSISFIGYLKYFKQLSGPHIIISPKSTLNNWLSELNKWIPDMKAFIFHGNKEERNDFIHNVIKPLDFEILITSYEICMLEKSSLFKVPWKYIIIDEAHRIKNENSLLSRIVRIFPSSHRLLLTGTPLQNNLHELWALLNFLLPDVFSNPEDFDNWFENRSDHDQMIQQLRKLLGPFLLRRLKADVEKTLLPKKEIILYVPLSDMQRNWYQKILEKDIDAINGLLIGSKRESKSRLMNIAMQLRKCANHPYLFEGAEPGPPYTTDEHLIQNSGKLLVLDGLLTRFKRSGSRVLIFSQMSRILDILEDYCTLRNYEYCRIDGSTTTEDRVQAIDEYNRSDSDKFIFLLTTRAGGLGINLSTADIVIMYDSDWNPQIDLQAQDRAHRIGQTKQVIVFKLVTENTIEERIIERSMQKLRLDQLVIQQGRLTTSAALKQEELLDMIRYGAKQVMDMYSTKDNSNISGMIEDLIKKGEERTIQLQEKYKNAGMEDLKFTSFSTYEFEGEDYRKKREANETSDGYYLQRSKRERKSVFDEDPYYVSFEKPGSKQSKQPLKQLKQLRIHDFQFYPMRLYELLEKEQLWFKKSIEYVIPSSDTEEKRQLEQEKIDQSQPLTKEEEEEKERLYQSGFHDWTRKDFVMFLKGCEKFGRQDFIKIAQEIGTKSVEDVKGYSMIFWKEFKNRLQDHERILSGIERGELKLKRAVELQMQLDYFVKYYDSREGYQWPKSKYYTPEEDYFLLYSLQKYGYLTENVYDLIRESIRKCPIFRFDFFIKSRTSIDIAKRCHAIIPSIQKWLVYKGIWIDDIHSEIH